MGLSITQTYAKIGIQTNPSKLEIESQYSRLELHQKHAKIDIESELPKVEIDQSECFASAGLKNVGDVIREEAQKGYQQALEYTGKVVSDGNALAAIENGGNAIAQIAKRDSINMHEFDIDCIPKVGPKITVHGYLDINAEKNAQGVNNGVEGNFIPANINMKYTPSQVKVFLSQYASIKFNYNNDSEINTYV